MTTRLLLRLTFALTASALAVFACSEATDGDADATRVPATPADAGADTTDASNGPGAEDGAAPRPTFDAATTSSTVVLLNEVSGSGEWIELVNAGSAAIDVSGWRVADRDKDTGGPKVGEAATFEPGTVLSPRAYALVKGGGVDAGKPCPEGGWSYCVFADFGISAKNGETIFLLWPDGGVAGSAVMPPLDGGSKESWSRVPSGTPDGGFAVRGASPGAKNPD